MKSTRYICMTLLVMLLAITAAFAQRQITASGTVVNKDLFPLKGVTVSNTDGDKTQTDASGKFTLASKDGAVLSFTFIGYLPRSVNSATNMQVVLEENTVELDAIQVVGVGYGTMRKSDLTGAITSVSAKDLRQGVITSAEQLLQGKVAGLTVNQPSGDPTQGSSMRLRGGTSLSASNSPLIVVDGVPGVDMNTVQPTEIVSIDVLKDASAAAIYGSRGANGVIIVTTNRENGTKTMDYTGYVAVGNVAKNLDLLSANQWRELVRDQDLKAAVDYGGHTDWQKELERTATTNAHNLSFANGGKEGGMRASLGYLNSEGVIKTSSLKRLSGTLNAYQYGLNNKLRLEASVYANRDDYHPIDITVFQHAYNLNPTLPVMQNGSYTQIGGDWNNNPVEILMKRRDDQSRNRLLGYGKAELEILEGLKATATGSYEYNAQQVRFYAPASSFQGNADKGYGRRTLGDYQNFQLESYLNYDKTFDAVHKLNVMAGYSYLKNQYEGFGAERRRFDTDFFGYNNIGAGTDARMGDVFSYKGEAKLISFFGRANYIFNDRYMLTGTLRRDGSSRFGPNHKWGWFPSISAAWRISQEDFMAATHSWLNNLKLRLGYGVTGNQDGIGEYKSQSLMGTGGGVYYDYASNSWKQSYSIIQNPNADLKWESTAQTNIGLDFSLFNRFNVTVDAYIKKTSDLLYTYTVPQPPYLHDRMLANVGDLTNKGIEVSVSANIIQTNDFTWNANLVLAHNKQVVDRLSNDLYKTESLSSGNLHGLTGMTGVYTQILKEGYAVGTFWGPKYVGLNEDKKVELEKDADGNVMQQYLGNAQPKLTTGFTMYFAYKGLDLNVATNGMFGQKILNAQRMNISFYGRFPEKNILDSYVGDPSKDGPVFSDQWIEKGNFLRLQSLTLGYNIPVSNNWFKRIRVYATGENLFVITKYSGIDPEVNITGLRSPGIDKAIDPSNVSDNYYYPRARTYSFGVNLSF
ncbi:SusC/RagA family TonB-linked outer membrane protein [Sphingobacterium sp. Mn56C]|uniref:SusC/RagA family TonB-linked outer membrane protein n=1 Tax=Sphingobacterium sp. Mn56C TaxID=3395261 RepID=UPI003BD6A3E2